VNLIQTLKSLSRSAPVLRVYRLAALWLVHVCVFAVSGVVAFLLRFDFQVKPPEGAHLLYGLAIWIPAKSLSFHVFHVNRTWWRYASLPDLVRIAIALFCSALVSTPIIIWITTGFPRSIFILDLLICLVLTSAVCAVARLQGERKMKTKPGKRVRALIYGAGVAGTTLARELRMNVQLGYEVCGYIDDNTFKRRAIIQGVPVVGTGDDLDIASEQLAIDEVLVAIPSATGSEMSRILDRCEQAQLSCRTIPGITEIIENRDLARQIRDIAVEDLLGRMPIRLEQNQIASKLRGQTVLVTGAAGSIGSELCRQIARFSPAAIVGFDIAETALFYLELEMAERFSTCRFYPEVGTVRDCRRLSDVFTKFHPTVVFHAAAYKHVPMMERHPFSAVENNVLGTVNVANAAAQYEAERLVMISTDKAVHPTSIMGLTKRVSELYINSLRNGTKYVSVRFGNVLGSNGSVIPIFSKQIGDGGPVTVTHPEMRRYFMTIPEASQLVLQAGSMGQGGEIFILDMGQPVLIADLARKLIRLSGLRPDVDIRIVYTGMRPGEKLNEELTGMDEMVLPTCHEKIRVHQGQRIAQNEIAQQIDALRSACADRDADHLLSILKELVPTYSPRAVETTVSRPAGRHGHVRSIAAAASSTQATAKAGWAEFERLSP
jgi:FlaA1/EpsC-like NDP-sugar epimerase